MRPGDWPELTLEGGCGWCLSDGGLVSTRPPLPLRLPTTVSAALANLLANSADEAVMAALLRLVLSRNFLMSESEWSRP